MSPMCHRCGECGASLSHQYYEKDGRLYCKKDYWARFGELCHGCAEQITKGLVMVRGGGPGGPSAGGFCSCVGFVAAGVPRCTGRGWRSLHGGTDVTICRWLGSRNTTLSASAASTAELSSGMGTLMHWWSAPSCTGRYWWQQGDASLCSPPIPELTQPCPAVGTAITRWW